MKRFRELDEVGISLLLQGCESVLDQQLRADLEAAQKRKDDVSQSAKALSSELTNCATRLYAHERQQSELHEQVQELRKDLENKCAKLSTAKARKCAAMEQLKAVQQSLTSRVNKDESLKEKLSATKNNLAACTAAVERCHMKVAANRTNHAITEDALAKLTQDRKISEEALALTAARRAAAQEEVDRIEKDLATVKSWGSFIKSAFSVAVGGIAGIIAGFFSAGAGAAPAVTAGAALGSAIGDLVSARVFRDRTAILHEQLTEAKAVLKAESWNEERDRENLALVEREASVLTMKVADLSVALKSSEAAAQLQESHLLEASTIFGKLQAELHEKENVLAALQTEYEHFADEEAQFTTEVTDSTNRWKLSAEELYGVTASCDMARAQWSEHRVHYRLLEIEKVKAERLFELAQRAVQSVEACSKNEQLVEEAIESACYNDVLVAK